MESIFGQLTKHSITGCVTGIEVAQKCNYMYVDIHTESVADVSTYVSESQSGSWKLFLCRASALIFLYSADQLLPPQVTNGYRTHTPPPVLRHNLNPPPSHPPHTLPTPSLPLPRLPRRSHSVDALDSMIIIQYVENDSEDHAEGEKEGVGSSHLAGR